MTDFLRFFAMDFVSLTATRKSFESISLSKFRPLIDSTLDFLNSSMRKYIAPLTNVCLDIPVATQDWTNRCLLKQMMWAKLDQRKCELRAKRSTFLGGKKFSYLRFLTLSYKYWHLNYRTILKLIDFFKRIIPKMCSIYTIRCLVWTYLSERCQAVRSPSLKFPTFRLRGSMPTTRPIDGSSWRSGGTRSHSSPSSHQV